MPTLTINFTADQASRIAAAYGDKIVHGGAPLTMAQFKAHLIAEMKSTVLSYETRQAHRAAVAAAPKPASIDPT